MSRWTRIVGAARLLDPAWATAVAAKGHAVPRLVGIAELDLDMGTQQLIDDSPTVWVVLNTEGGWELQKKGLPIRLISDRS